jgi:hypothetical protein
MGRRLPRSVRRLQAKADLYRILARNTQSLVERQVLLRMAQDQDRKILEELSPGWRNSIGALDFSPPGFEKRSLKS